MIFYKAVRPDGTDFYTGTVRWAPEQGEIPEGGIIEPTQPQTINQCCYSGTLRTERLRSRQFTHHSPRQR